MNDLSSSQATSVSHASDESSRGEAPTSPLAPYFRDIAGVDVMTRDQELTAAAQLADLRRVYWKSLLAYPPFIDGICQLARELLEPAVCPVAALDAMKKASRELRDRDLLVHQQAYEAAREQLTAAMAEADRDGDVSDRVLADLGSIEAGSSEGLSMKVKLPRRGSLPFMSYVATARRNHHALSLARRAFVAANLRLVVTLARRFNTGRLPLQDLIQEGNCGLMKAVDRFDHRKGFRFSTYASWWIRHAVTRAIADKARTVRLPVHMVEVCNKTTRARREFLARHGRAPTEVELAEATGVSLERIRRMNYSLIENPVSLDQPLAGDGRLTVLDAIEDTSAPAAGELMDNELLLDNLRDVLRTLSPMEADILQKRFGGADDQDMTLKEIGAGYSLSRERIRQVQEQALTKLRDEFKRRALL